MPQLAIAIATAVAALAPAAPRAEPIAPGEETVLSVRWLGMRTGEGRISVGRPEGDIWPVFFQVKTAGVANFLDIREHLVSYWDGSSHLPRGSELQAVELGDRHDDRTRFDRQARQITVESERKSGRKVKTASIPEDAHDLFSAFIYLRGQPLAVGEHHELPVCSGVECFTLVADVLSREKVKTDAGTFEAMKVSVRTALNGNFSTKRDSVLWFSDDPRHVLVQFSADFKVGAIVATLKSYRPGLELAAVR